MKKERPFQNLPRKALAFLEWYCPEALFEGILGDLVERFNKDSATLGLKKARRRFTWNVILFFHPSIFMKRKAPEPILNPALLKSHFIVSFRNLKKYSFHTFINISGLTLSLACVVLVFLFISNELSFDQFHQKKDEIFRVYHKKIIPESGQISDQSAVTAVPLSKDLAESLPMIQNYSRLGSGAAMVKINESPFQETVSFADTGFFGMFDFPVLYGDPKTALSDINSVALSSQLALKYFGSGDVLGRSIVIDLNGTEIESVISLVYDAKKAESSLQCDLILPFEKFELLSSADMMSSYRYGIVENYIQVDKVSELEELESALTSTIQRFITNESRTTSLHVQALSQMHTEDEILGNALFVSPRKMIIMFFVAFLVLLVAAINFLTLSTAQSIGRLAEMGLRKTLGAFNRQMKIQLTSEAIVIVAIASILAIGLAYLTHPAFSQLTQCSFPFKIELRHLGYLVLIGLLIGLLAGVIQASLIVRQGVVDALEKKVFSQKNQGWFSRSLMVFQFAISIVLIIATIHIYAQMRFVHNTDLGFNKEQLIEISMGSPSSTEEAERMVDVFRNEAKGIEGVVSVSSSMNNSREPWTHLGFEQDDGATENIYFNQIDPFYLQTMQVRLQSGNDYSPDQSNNESGLLVNEALVNHFGWGEDALGRQIPGARLDNNHSIVGIVENFHFGTMHERIEPLILALDVQPVRAGITGLSTYVWPPNLYQIIVRINGESHTETLNNLKESWIRVQPDKEFVFHFVDDSIRAKYAEETRWSRLIGVASLFTIFMAWMGLFAILRITIQKKRKEIGIRRVLGSTVLDVIKLITGRYLGMVLLGALISIPISTLIVLRWFENFEYHIDLQIPVYIGSILGIFIFTALTALLQSLRITGEQPARTLYH